MSTKIELCNLHKRFGSKNVLNGVDLKVKKGESLVILGGSGTGKSVLIKIIASIIEPDSGSIFIDSVDFLKAKQSQKQKIIDKMGFLFQGGALFDSLKIWENVAFRLLNQNKVNLKDVREIAIEKLTMVGLNSRVADAYPSELSGGMQKRASLARTIASNPDIIFFDEPTTGLDPIMSNVINDLIVDNSKRLGATTITITHDLDSAQRIADKVAMLYNGKIIWLGNVEDVMNSGNPFLDQFVNRRPEGPIKF
ncbi:MAG: ATP-binding cassette domain-containing protein [Rickettsiales bacterium]|nr:ATP-binding cassette domain-containing protein [Rickettsiales bacterium]